MRRATFPPRAVRRGFTLVEVLIVVVILGILAATVLPQFTSATEDAKESALKQNLQQIRTQIDLYKFQHNGNLPIADSALDFYKSMLCKTAADGTTTGQVTDTSATDIGDDEFGPYLLGQFPPNPFNSRSDVNVTATANPKNGSTGWWYNAATGEIRANVADTVVGTSGTKMNAL